MKLTVRNIANLDLGGKSERIVFDDDIAGFGIRLREGGSRTWVYQYRIGRKQRRMVLGSAKSVPLSVARENASRLEAKVRLGGDPAMDKEIAREEADNTFGALVERYIEERRSDWRPYSEKQFRRHLNKYAAPLHRLPIAAISQRQVASLLTDLAKKSGDVTSNRVRSTISSLLAWAMRQGIRLPEGNVASNTDRRTEKSRERVLSDAELRAIWKAAAGEYGAVLKLLILTGQRANEIGLLRWDEVHDEQILLPGSRTKNGRPHIIPLSEAAKTILIPLSEAAKTILAKSPRARRTSVFGREDIGFRDWSNAKRYLDERIPEAGTPLPHWTVHDLRRTVATRMAELGVQPHVIEAVLNHVSGAKSGVAGIYNRASYDKEKREALELWAAHVEALIVGPRKQPVPTGLMERAFAVARGGKIVPDEDLANLARQLKNNVTPLKRA